VSQAVVLIRDAEFTKAAVIVQSGAALPVRVRTVVLPGVAAWRRGKIGGCRRGPAAV